MREIWTRSPALRALLKKQQLSKDKMYRWSQFVFRLEETKECFLYHTLTMQCVQVEGIYLPESRFSPAQLADNPELGNLMENYFLVPVEKDEASFYREIYRLQRLCQRRQGYAGMTILPTWACNARCTYCFEEGFPQTTMSEDTVEKTIAFILSSRQKDKLLHLKWFGGEPILGAAIIDRICLALEGEGVPYQSAMTTNGSLITEEIADKMNGLWHMRKVKVSMDCAEETYKHRKNYPVYKHTYRQVMENVNLLLCRGINVNLRCNVDEGNMADIPEFLSDLGRVIEKKEQLAVGFAPLHASAKNSTCLPLMACLRKARRLTEEHGFVSYRPGDAFSFRVNHCMADNPEGNVVIAPTGELYPCTFCEPGTSFGNVTEGVTRPELLAAYMEVGEIPEKCRDCPFLPRCTPFSRCPVENYYCRENQRLDVKELLLWRIREKGVSKAPEMAALFSQKNHK